MSTHLIQLIDLEIRKLTIAREALVGSGQQPQPVGEQEITATALLNGVDVHNPPSLFPEASNENHRQVRPIQKRAGGMSEAGRAAVAAAQKARWAKKKAEENKKARRTG